MEQSARLDLVSERNDRERYPDGAYIDIEHHLLRLALVSEVTPRYVAISYCNNSTPENEMSKLILSKL